MTDKSDKEVELIPIMVLSNDPTEFKVRTIELLYQSLATGQLAYMDGKDVDTGEIVPLLVGLNPINDERMAIYPIAKLLINSTDTSTYLVPNGVGEYTKPDVDNAVDFGGARLESADFGDEEEAGPTEGLNQKAVGTIH